MYRIIFVRTSVRKTCSTTGDRKAIRQNYKIINKLSKFPPMKSIQIVVSLTRIWENLFRFYAITFEFPYSRSNNNQYLS